MKQNEKFFLPMEEEAIKCLQGYMKADIVEALLTFLEYRGERDSKGEFDYFEILKKAEKKYQQCLLRMKREAGQLYQYTPPQIHKIIAAQYKKEISRVEKLLDKHNVIEQVKKSITNNNSKIENEEESARIVTLGKTKKQGYLVKEKFEFINPGLIHSKHFEDYLNVLNVLFDELQTALDVFFAPDILKPLSKTSTLKAGGKLSKYIPYSSVMDFIEDRGRFEKACKKYSDEHILWRTREVKVISYNKKTGKYHWNGIGDSRIPTLAQFLTELFYAGIFNFDVKLWQAKAFLDFFDLSNEDPKYLSREMLKTGSIYKDIFNIA